MLVPVGFCCAQDRNMANIRLFIAMCGLDTNCNHAYDELGVGHLACSWKPEAVTLPAHGWAPPTGEVPTGLPFAVDRAGVAGSLPVYRDIRHGRTKVYTIVRKLRGDAAVRNDDPEEINDCLMCRRCSKV